MATQNQYNNKIALADGTILLDISLDDVKPEHVQKGIKFHDKTGAPQEGTNTKTVDASQASADAAEVLETKTFGKGSEMQTGTMPNNSGKTVILKPTVISNPDGQIIDRGFYDGATAIKLSESDFANLTPGNIKEGVQILGIEGEFGADDVSSQSKEVTPSFEDQTINPDAGISYLSSVKVKAIPVSKVDNDAGGVTVTIG